MRGRFAYRHPTATPLDREKIWDHAAGICIVEEAGGMVSDAKGRRLRVNEGRFLPEDLGGGIVAGSSAEWHARLVSAIAASEAVSETAAK